MIKKVHTKEFTTSICITTNKDTWNIDYITNENKNLCFVKISNNKRYIEIPKDVFEEMVKGDKNG